MNTFAIGNRRIDQESPVYVIAEVANTHEGSLETARKMVDAVAGSGVDAVKFQLHFPAAEMIHSHPKFVTQGQRSLSLDDLKELKTYVEEKGLTFLCSGFSREAVDALVEMNLPALKVGSGEVSDPDFLEHVAKKGVPTILSTGMTTLEEVATAVEIFKKHGTPYMLLHCASVYPADYKHLNLDTIRALGEEFEVPVGFSDHTAEILSSVASVAFGAVMIEKHYTLDRAQEGTSDHKVSLQPEEFIELVKGVRSLEVARGVKTGILPEEEEVIAWARHAVVTVRDIEKGATITREDISTKRPLFDGVPAARLSEVLGKKAIRAIKADDLVRWDDLAP